MHFRFTNIGDVKNGPYIDTDKKLKLKYEQGKICSDPNGPDHISTIITFECAQEVSRIETSLYAFDRKGKGK